MRVQADLGTYHSQQLKASYVRRNLGVLPRLSPEEVGYEVEGEGGHQVQEKTTGAADVAVTSSNCAIRTTRSLTTRPFQIYRLMTFTLSETTVPYGS